ncbi:MAG: ABC transporter ATP-binding protein [Gammaproteobacteria bacterium]|nr:ABC transporter ATP-binding protein [Gammaproteobacteria bacterium]
MQALSIRQLTKVYSNGVEALKGVDLDVREGDFFALLGPNGAGKTTLIGIVTSLVNKTAGEVRIFGLDLEREQAAAKACLGVVPQEINLNHFDRLDNILVNQAGFYGITAREARKRAQESLEQMQLWDRREEIARNLSGGMKRRLMIARALVHRPRLLILDEPTAGVDIEIRRSMWGFLTDINAAGTTIILTTHYLEEAESLCRHVAIIDQGLIVEHDQMATVIRKLHREIFILNTIEPLNDLPPLDGFRAELLSEHELQVEVTAGQDLNAVFGLLSAADVHVSSMRNKSNRLEEVFFRLTDRTSEQEFEVGRGR